MDFHTLSRKQLQALCKKNKIPANMTNLAMADSLAALEQVEGLEEVLYPVETDAQKFPDEKCVGTPACRTSTRRKPVMEEPESSKISTCLRRGTRVRNGEEIDQENKDSNVPVTPSGPTTRRRAPAASTRRKKEDEKLNNHVPKTPAASNSRVKATPTFNTRKSMRLLERSLSKMSLMDKEDTGSVNVDAISEELSSVSQQVEGSEDIENVVEKTDESELTTLEKNLSEISFMDADETESVKVDEISKEMNLPRKIEESEDAVEGASSQIISTELIEKTDELELTSSEKNTEFEIQSNESGTRIICQIENSCNYSEPEIITSPCTENDAFSGDKQKSNEHMGNDTQNSAIMLTSHAENEAVDKMEDDLEETKVPEVDYEVDASMIIIEDKNEASDIQEGIISDENKATEAAHDNQSSEEMFSGENKIVETSCDIQNSEEMEFKTSSDIEEESKDYVEKDAVMEVCNEDKAHVQSVADSQSSEGYINEDEAESETADVQSSLVRNEAEAEYETSDVQIGNEDHKENADVPIHLTCQDQSALKDNAAVEVKSVREMRDEEGDKEKENQIDDNLTSKSIRQLKKMLKNSTLHNKTNNDKSSNNSIKEVEKKRTALQELPENRMTAS